MLSHRTCYCDAKALGPIKELDLQRFSFNEYFSSFSRAVADKIFIRPDDELAEELTTHQNNFQVPVVDLDGIRDERLEEIVEQVRAASETWGFFQVVNHGIPLDVLDKVLDGARKFHDEDHEVKKELYSRDPKRDLTLGTTKHSDPSFLTIVLQDQIGGLQVFYKNQWVDVQPVAGGLVVISNNKLKSDYHRVVANGFVPRISVACFLTGHATGTPKLYGPVKQLTSEENPPVYRDFLISEYLSSYFSGPVGDNSVLYQFKL
ncbi:hypothetical protein Patl1_25155 [Pistacia atlantica]|uniref:Uncharacterized protein n=1 Tax=Pistacia atlantica TaxID=434234 RepID=A0ACC1B375_9ROSI|nr:hypothetical protein Patl1_25155 [Pistacia atlantica]